MGGTIIIEKQTICGLCYAFELCESEAPHSRAVGHLMAKAIEVALTVVCPNRSRAAGYSDKKKKPSRNCCVAGLFKEKEKATREEIVQYCCVERCHHGAEYHNTQCPIKLVGINDQYPLNPTLIDRLMHVQIQEFHVPNDNHQRQLSDF